MQTKVCSKCGPPALPIDRFSFSRPGIRRSYCKQCEIRKNREYEKSRMERDPEYREHHRAKGRRRTASYRKRHRDRFRQSVQKHTAKAISSLSDSYVRAVLAQEMGVPAAAIPPKLVELKRALIQLRREMRSQAT